MDDVCGFRNSANSAVVSKDAAAAAAAGGASAIWNKNSIVMYQKFEITFYSLISSLYRKVKEIESSSFFTRRI